MVLSFFAKVYEKIVRVRNRKFDEDIYSKVSISLPVISVGNLSVGGTGKTPFVQMLTRELLKLNVTPAIIGRGYKKKSKGEIIVCDGKKLLADAATAGDEMFLLAKSLMVPVIAGEVKANAAQSAEKRFDVDCLIVDDGFQHRKLNRNLDIVLIDQETLAKPELLPSGRLREPLDSIKRADVICLTGSAIITDELKQYAKKTAVYIRVKAYQDEPYCLDNNAKLKPEEKKTAQKAIVPFAGIAKPQRFFEMIKSNNFNGISHVAFSDHHNYDRNDIEKILRICKEKNCKYIATTEKDAAKLMNFSDRFTASGITCLVFPISLKITEGSTEFFNLLKLSLLK